LSEIELFPLQAKIVTDPHRFIGVFAGVQGAKTTTGALWFCNELWDFKKNCLKDYNSIILAPTYKIMNQATLPKFLEIFPPSWGEYKSGASNVDLVNGKKIYIRSTENPDCFEGITAGQGWLDEAPMMKAKAWINMQGRLAILGGRCINTGTPEKQGWTKFDFIDHWKNSDPDYQVYEYESIENPYFPKAEFERMRRILPPAIFARRYQGKHMRLEGLVFADFNMSHVVDPFQIPREWEVIAGIDFGYNNPAAFLLIAIDHDGNFYVFDEYYQSERTTKEHGEEINRRYEYSVCYCDPSAKQEQADLQNYLLGRRRNLQPAKNSVLPGITKVAEFFRSNRIKIFKTCKNLIDEIEGYQFKEGVDEPVKSHDHACDALRYALFSHDVATGGSGRFSTEKRSVGHIGSLRDTADMDIFNVR
jgi:PBSX family phage terminase large subunit